MASARKQIRRAVQSTIARVVVALLAPLPAPLARRVGRGLGRIAWLISPLSRRRTREHLSLAFGETRSAVAIERIARANLPALGAPVAEAVGIAARGIPATLSRDPIDGYDKFVQAVAEARQSGRGLIGIGGHFGSWELLAGLFSHATEGDALCVARRYEVEGYQTVLEGMRHRLGVRVVYQEDSLMPIVRHLRQGGVLGLLPDQDFKNLQDGIFVDFLGRPAYTTTTPAQIALRTGASIFVATLHRRDGTLVLDASPVRHPDEFRGEEDPVRAITAWWSKCLEQRIRAAPEQWVWLHRRWRTTPDRLVYRSYRRKEREEKRRRREGKDLTKSSPSD